MLTTNKCTADFETTTDPNDCRVWAWGVYDIMNLDFFTYGNSIESFFEFAQTSEYKDYYFQNLRFDGEFLLVWLFENGYRHVIKKEDEDTKTFTTLISDKGQFYSIKVIFERKGKKKKSITIYDSLKILPFSVEQVAKAFGLPVQKQELDYTTFRPVGHMLTEKEISYLRADVEIMARALNVLFNQGLTKMTQGANALHDYKEMTGKKNFERWFPTPDYDADVRQSYKGGYTFLQNRYKEIDLFNGLVFDVNSLYPWVMHDCPLPYGEPIFFYGQYKEDKLYNLYVQMFTCQFDLKKDHIPTIQLKNNLAFIPTQYVESSGYEEVTLCLTSVDLELFFEHYDVYNIVYHSGWKFKSTTGLFTDYIDKWVEVKNESTRTKNKAMRTLAKLMLNALYGKFALNPNVQSKIPYYDNGQIKYILGEKETRKPLYIPVGTFITAWARHKTITTAQKLYPYFVYADTDSVHLNLPIPEKMFEMEQDEIENLTTKDLQEMGLPLPDDFVVHPTDLGAWKLETVWHRARFIRQKTYMEDCNPPETWDGLGYCKGLVKITCAGMPSRCYPLVTWDNFRSGAKYSGKLMPKHVRGGIVLQETEFTIQKL